MVPRGYYPRLPHLLITGFRKQILVSAAETESFASLGLPVGNWAESVYYQVDNFPRDYPFIFQGIIIIIIIILVTLNVKIKHKLAAYVGRNAAGPLMPLRWIYSYVIVSVSRCWHSRNIS